MKYFLEVWGRKKIFQEDLSKLMNCQCITGINPNEPNTSKWLQKGICTEVKH